MKLMTKLCTVKKLSFHFCYYILCHKLSLHLLETLFGNQSGHTSGTAKDSADLWKYLLLFITWYFIVKPVLLSMSGSCRNDDSVIKVTSVVRSRGCSGAAYLCSAGYHCDLPSEPASWYLKAWVKPQDSWMTDLCQGLIISNITCIRKKYSMITDEMETNNKSSRIGDTIKTLWNI